MALPLLRLAAAAAAGYYFYNRSRKSRMTGKISGSQTNASDAVDDIELNADSSHDDVVDAGVQETFPASDPVSVKPSETAFERQQRGG
jgi:hypothetical protein